MDEQVVDFYAASASSFEIDFDYEFDAPRYYDFITGDSVAEAREAELWFSTARTYPASPCVARMSGRNFVSVDSTNIFQNLRNVEHATFRPITLHNAGASQAFDTGNLNIFNCNAKKHVKSTFSRVSTLMKPTASHLAKQKHHHNNKFSTQLAQRCDKVFSQRAQRILDHQSTNECHAAKRQKLQDGHLCKIAGTQQLTSLTHKVLKKDGHGEGFVEQPRLKLTIPREPELATAKRAERLRNFRLSNHPGAGGSTQTATSTFITQPLDQKTAEASVPPRKCTPKSSDFQAAITGAAVTNLRVPEQSLLFSGSQRHREVDCSGQEDGDTQRLTASSLHKKTFNFLMDKCLQQMPPTDLFSKLSLTCGVQQHTATHAKLSQAPYMHIKASKENRGNLLRQVSKGGVE